VKAISGDIFAMELLVIALLRIRSSPMKQTKLSPFKVLYGCPPPLFEGIQGGGNLKEICDLTLMKQMQALGLSQSKINDWVWKRFPISLTTPMHL
jgi:hypothetical protein